MELVEIGPDDRAHVAAFVRATAAINAVDCPWEPVLTLHRQEMEMRHSWDDEPGRWFLAYAGDEPVGLASLHTSDYDNLEMAWLQVRVVPAHRRRGHGTAVLKHVESLAVDLGRPLFHVADWDTAATHGFALAHGYERRSAEIRRMQVVSEVPDLRPIRDEALASAGDYELLRIEGYTPDALLPAVAALTEAINDAPLDDLEWEDEVYSPERVRAYERAQIESGHRFRRVIARHRRTGELAGHSDVVVDGEQPYAEQHDTSVTAAHRGHRLGLLLKTEMLLWLTEAEPALERIYTWNAESNDHMIAVNERLGYRVLGRAAEFQRRAR
ncbi:MAG TPA: GNAT family N-acetyltransferase [Marmoricola sp.]